MVNRRGTSTKNAYMRSAGATNSQPMMFSRRTTLLREIHRENTETAGRLFDFSVDVTVGLVGAGIAHHYCWAISLSYSAWTAFRSPAASCLLPTIFWSSGVQPWAKIELVELAIKSIDVPALPTTGPAASVSFVTEPAVTEGIVASAGPPGLEPPMATSICRALSFEATQFRKNTAQSAFFALAAIP